MSIDELAFRCRSSLPATVVIDGRRELADYEGNLSEFTRAVPLAVRPSSTDDVTRIIGWARELRIPLFPISQGKNWGLGSKLPVQSGSVIVDLSGMNAIRELDLEMGCALIEPGVTQIQLAEALKGSPFILDVTGSGVNTSIVGNALDRGVAYHSLRCETVSPQEIVLGNGEVLSTGHGHFKNARTALFCRAGAGPGLENLFYQSNFGIVTAAVVQLRRRPDCQRSFTVFPRAGALPELIEKLRDLKQRGVLQGIPHLFNRPRLVPAVASLVRTEGLKEKRLLDRSAAEGIVNRRLPGDWIVAGHLGGERAMVRAARRTIASELRPLGRVDFMSDGKSRWIEMVLKLLRRRDDLLLLNAFKAVRGYSSGVPTDAALSSTVWPVSEMIENHGVRDLDRGPAGFLYCVPLFPARAADVRAGLATIDAVCAPYGFEPAISLNLVSERMFEVVVSISFPRERADLVRRAHECLRTLTRSLLDNGYPPYRLDIDGQRWIADENDGFWRCVRALKSAVDPDGVIAPGRYCPDDHHDS